jgi:hypothetical protein
MALLGFCEEGAAGGGQNEKGKLPGFHIHDSFGPGMVLDAGRCRVGNAVANGRRVVTAPVCAQARDEGAGAKGRQHCEAGVGGAARSVPFLPGGSESGTDPRHWPVRMHLSSVHRPSPT